MKLGQGSKGDVNMLSFLSNNSCACMYMFGLADIDVPMVGLSVSVCIISPFRSIVVETGLGRQQQTRDPSVQPLDSRDKSL